MGSGGQWIPNAYSARTSNFTRLDPNRSDAAMMIRSHGPGSRGRRCPKQVRLLVPVHHRLRLLTFPMRAGIGDAVPVRHETVEDAGALSRASLAGGTALLNSLPVTRSCMAANEA